VETKEKQKKGGKSEGHPCRDKDSEGKKGKVKPMVKEKSGDMETFGHEVPSGKTKTGLFGQKPSLRAAHK